MGYSLFDQYTILHFAVGIIVYFWGMSLWLWTILHILFESFENTSQGMWLINRYITFWPGGKTHADNLLNSASDVIAGSFGWLVARWLDSIYLDQSIGKN
jgi:hypothetical protein